MKKYISFPVFILSAVITVGAFASCANASNGQERAAIENAINTIIEEREEAARQASEIYSQLEESPPPVDPEQSSESAQAQEQAQEQQRDLSWPNVSLFSSPCVFPYQGRQTITNTIGRIDCTTSSAAFPGPTPDERCLKIDYDGYDKKNYYKITNNSQETLFIPLKTKEEWDAFIKTKEINNFEVDICVPIKKGECGIITKMLATYVIPPPKGLLCNNGTPTAPVMVSTTNPANSRMWSWKCIGNPDKSSNNVMCNTIPSEANDGACGSANNVYSLTAPASNLCDIGTSTTPSQVTTAASVGVPASTYWAWTCLAPPPNLGDSASCQSSPLQKNNAVCGVSGILNAAPAVGLLCSSGTSSNFIESIQPNGATSWTWTCTSADGGTPSSCNASLLNINAQCGPAITKSTATAPTSDFCKDNLTNSSVVETNTSFTWVCNGQGSGTDASCTATKAPSSSGTCGSLSGTTISNPTTNPYGMCSQGTVSNTSYDPRTLHWSWVCKGVNGGTDSPACTATGIKGCGELNGTTIGTTVSLNSSSNGLCGFLYTPSSPVATNVQTPPHLHFTWSWICTGTNNSLESGQIYNCSAIGTTGCPFSGGSGPNPCNFPDP